MTDVFLLGAGFSKATNIIMPTLKELSIEVKNLMNNTKNSFPSPLLELGDNIELWLTYLSQSQPWLKEHNNLENKALYLKMVETIGDILDKATETTIKSEEPDWLRSLIHYWHTHNSNIITLNYDTIVESAAFQQDIFYSNLYPAPLPDIRRTSIYVAEELNTFVLHKLHGSVNWYYSGAPSYFGEVIYSKPIVPWGKPDKQFTHFSKLAGKDKVPLIIPPTSEKNSYLYHETMRHIWASAATALQNASRLFIIGYSLPTTDLGIRFLLQYCKPSPKATLFIVNKDNICTKRYRELLQESYLIDDSFVEQGVEGLVDYLLA